MQRLVKVDGKVRTDPTYPAGFMGKLEKYFLLKLAVLSFLIASCCNWIVKKIYLNKSRLKLSVNNHDQKIPFVF